MSRILDHNKREVDPGQMVAVLLDLDKLEVIGDYPTVDGSNGQKYFIMSAEEAVNNCWVGKSKVLTNQANCIKYDPRYGFLNSYIMEVE